MTDKKLSELTASSTVDYLYGEVGGVSKKITPANIGNGFVVATTNILSAQILTLQSIPVVIVPAQGNNTVAVPLWCSATYFFGSAAYVDAPNLKVGYSTNPDNGNLFNFSNILTNTENAMGFAVSAQEAGPYYLKSVLNNSPVYIVSALGSDPTTGDGTLSIETGYFVIDI